LAVKRIFKSKPLRLVDINGWIQSKNFFNILGGWRLCVNNANQRSTCLIIPSSISLFSFVSSSFKTALTSKGSPKSIKPSRTSGGGGSFDIMIPIAFESLTSSIRMILGPSFSSFFAPNPPSAPAALR
jgi:hypothetical protein